jgi:hypothetical protein
MKLRYDMSVEDLAAGHVHRVLRTTIARRPFLILFGSLIGCMWLPALLMTVFGLLAFVEDLSRTDILLAVLLFGGLTALVPLMMWWYPRLIRSTALDMQRLMRRKGENTGLLGLQEMELADRELIHRSEHAESRMRFTALVEVTTEAGYTFIITNSVSALTIPHAAVTEGDVEAFTAALKQKLADPALAAMNKKSSSGGVG